MSKILKNGRIVRDGNEFVRTFGVVTMANQAIRKLEADSPINGETVTGIQCRRVTTGAKSLNGNNLVNANVFNSTHLTLKQRNAEVLTKVPLEAIALATDNGLWYEVYLPLVDMSQSSIECKNPSAIVDGEEYELIFRYERK